MNNDELRIWRDLKTAERQAQQQRLRLAEAKKQLMLAQQQAKTKARHPDAAKYRLGADDVHHGFVYEDAEARAWLRDIPLVHYVTLLESMGAREDEPVAKVELAAVRSHYDTFTRLGQQLMLAREIERYEERHRSFLAWVAENPSRQTWRAHTPKLRQLYLIERTAAALEIDHPVGLNCGEAHDWLAKHGANVRLRLAQSQKGTTTQQHDADTAVDLFGDEENEA